MRDLTHNIDVTLSLNATDRTASTNGTGVDLQGAEEAVVVFTFGTWTDGTHTPSIEESDTLGSGYAAVAAGDMTASTLAAVSAGGGSNTVQTVGYKGAKRFIRAVMTCAGTTTGAESGANVIRSRKRHIGGIA